MIRTTDAGLVNRLLERDGAEVDFTEILEEPLHVCLVEGNSGAIFMWRGPGIYELHLFYEVRGKAARFLLREMLEVMRLSFEARLFWAMIPMADRKTRVFARMMDWKSLGPRVTRHGEQELFVSEIVTCLQS